MHNEIPMTIPVNGFNFAESINKIYYLLFVNTLSY